MSQSEKSEEKREEKKECGVLSNKEKECLYQRKICHVTNQDLKGGGGSGILYRRYCNRDCGYQHSRRFIKERSERVCYQC